MPCCLSTNVHILQWPLRSVAACCDSERQRFLFNSQDWGNPTVSTHATKSGSRAFHTLESMLSLIYFIAINQGTFHINDTHNWCEAFIWQHVASPWLSHHSIKTKFMWFSVLLIWYLWFTSKPINISFSTNTFFNYHFHLP